jgi:hypothetical protein
MAWPLVSTSSSNYMGAIGQCFQIGRCLVVRQTWAHTLRHPATRTALHPRRCERCTELKDRQVQGRFGGMVFWCLWLATTRR